MPFSLAAYQSVSAQETSQVWVILYSINHASFGTPYRFQMGDPDDFVSNGETYQPWFVDTKLSDSRPGEVPEATIVMDNVEGEIQAILENTTGSAATMTIEVVLSSDPDTVIVGPQVLAIKQTRVKSPLITGRLEGPDFLDELHPGLIMDKKLTPGLFAL